MKITIEEAKALVRVVVGDNMFGLPAWRMAIVADIAAAIKEVEKEGRDMAHVHIAIVERM